MRRLAIFVEGYTELLFVKKLVTEVANKNGIAIHLRKIKGGGKSGVTKRQFVELETPIINEKISHYVLIFDCGNDNLVAQRIKEEHENLTAKGYEKIIGLRDVYPQFSKEQINSLRRGLMTRVKTSLAPVEFLLGIMEVEAWFLAEHNHFKLIDESITIDRIHNELGFNPILDDMQNRDEPAKDLHKAYSLGGKEYKKGDVNGTTDKLDYSYMYVDLKNKIPDLELLVNNIDAFLS